MSSNAFVCFSLLISVARCCCCVFAVASVIVRMFFLNILQLSHCTVTMCRIISMWIEPRHMILQLNHKINGSEWLFAEMCTKQNTKILRWMNDWAHLCRFKSIFQHKITNRLHAMQTIRYTHIIYCFVSLTIDRPKPCSMPSYQSHSRCKFRRFIFVLPFAFIVCLLAFF